MGNIHVLDQQTANSIAAGEVVERPASVVKELIENALDAGATTVAVEITGGGILSIAIIDNGRGMDAADAQLAFSRHATSKMIRIEDLDTIGTLGFRGEALASIAAVAQVTLKTRQPGSSEGTEIRIDGGQLIHQGQTGCSEGTTILVEQLFYNTPARFKFLKKDSSESAAVAETIEKLILSRPDVSFRLMANGQELLHSPGNNDLTSAIYAVYGRKQANFCIPVSGRVGPLSIGGLIARPEGAKSNRSGQTVLVNGRLIRSKTITAAIDEAFKTRLMKGRFAFTVIQIDMPPELVDVNVHPQKLEVRFWKDGEVFSAVYQTIVSSLNEHAGVLAEEAAVADDIIPESAAAPDTSNGSTGQGSLTEAKDLSKTETTTGSVQGNRNISDSLIDQSVLEYLSVDVSVPPQNRPSLQLRDDDRPSTLLKAADLADARVIGQLFRTYILLELGEELLMIDQHAAHEKIIYERLRDRVRESNRQEQSPQIQPLLVPLTMSVTPSEQIILEAEKTLFTAIGFTFEAFGHNAIVIRTIPDLQSARIDPEAALRSALQTLLKARPKDHEAVNELLYQVACKAAVKAHDSLSDPEIRQLIADLASLENPYTCPHGRPVIIRIAQLDLEKKFKRVL